jgi:acetyl esterase/lipase
MTKIFTILAAVVVAAGLLYHFAALRIFNLLVPKDGGGSLLVEGLPYGEGPRRMLDLYTPDGPGPFPVVLFAYGGSWDSGRRQDYAFVARAFAAHGYLTAVADYRLVPDVLYPAFVEDTGMAITWVVANATRYGGDGKGVFLVGHSAGGYNLAQAVLTQNPAAVRAVALLAAPLDFLPLDSPKSIAAFSHVEDLASTQPVNLNLSAAPPMLLLHGADDTTVRIHNSRSLHAKLVAAGRFAEIKIYDDVGHVGIMLPLSKPFRGHAPVLEDVLAHFQRYR